LLEPGRWIKKEKTNNKKRDFERSEGRKRERKEQRFSSLIGGGKRGAEKQKILLLDRGKTGSRETENPQTKENENENEREREREKHHHRWRSHGRGKKL
jgi:hypothetical protein